MSKSTALLDTYNGVVITYDEHENLWRYTVRGRERSSESLTHAKSIIDKPEPSEKPPFKRCDAFYSEHSGATPRVVTVTSIAVRPKYNSYEGNYYWIIVAGKLERVAGNRLFSLCLENETAVGAFTIFEKQRRAAEEGKIATREGMKPFKPE